MQKDVTLSAFKLPQKSHCQLIYDGLGGVKGALDISESAFSRLLEINEFDEHACLSCIVLFSTKTTSFQPYRQIYPLKT